MCATIAAIFFIISIILGFIGKTLAKKRMSDSLGRQASDHDLSSINAWMQVTDKEEKAAEEKKQ